MTMAGYDSFTPLRRIQSEPFRRAASGPFLLKPLPEDPDAPSSSGRSNSKDTLNRHLSLFDLISIGIGGTIGSGLFVLCGLVAHDYAGPSTALSWALSGFAACTSGCCYAEMASRVPAAGSAYAYAFVAMGELWGVMAAACLSLEYIMAASAVARSWADKVVLYLAEELDDEHWIHEYVAPNLWSVSPLAFVISTASIGLLLNGVHESKAVTNFFTYVKVGVVAFMVIVGFMWVEPSNWSPFIPAQFGMAGVVRGSTATFFGYLGYDEVCQLAGEAQNPKRNLPIAIMMTLGGVTVLYITAALSLTGMQSYEDISPVSGFPAAFRANGATIAAQIASLGEVLTLPVVVPLTIIGQPRLQYALAQDGLLPSWFGVLDANGNLYNGTLFAGTICVLVATFVPFKHLNDMISAAVLMALNITDTSLILLWHESPTESPYLAEYLLSFYHIACLVMCLLLTRCLETSWGRSMSLVSAAVLLVCMVGVYRWCPKSEVFGGEQRRPKGGVQTSNSGYFRTPFVPFWPCFGILINWFLMAQLELMGIFGMLGFLALAGLYYFCYGLRHSVGNNGGWEETSDCSSEQTALVRTVSMPPPSRGAV